MVVGGCKQRKKELKCCRASVDSHFQKYTINQKSIDSECALSKIRQGISNDYDDDESLSICPKHRYIIFLYVCNVYFN